MKRHIALTLALSLGLFALSLTSATTAAEAAGRRPQTWTTGIITVPQGESVHFSVVAGPKAVSFVYQKIEYAAAVCSDGTCKYTVQSHSAPETIALGPGEAWSLGTSDPTGLSIVVTSSSGGFGVFADRIDANGFCLGTYEVTRLG